MQQPWNPVLKQNKNSPPEQVGRWGNFNNSQDISSKLDAINDLF